MGQMTQPTAS